MRMRINAVQLISDCGTAVRNCTWLPNASLRYPLEFRGVCPLLCSHASSLTHICTSDLLDVQRKLRRSFLLLCPLQSCRQCSYHTSPPYLFAHGRKCTFRYLTQAMTQTPSHMHCAPVTNHAKTPYRSSLLSPSHSARPPIVAISSSFSPIFTTENLIILGSNPSVLRTVCCVFALLSKRRMK